jgi:hypothetical protein
MDVMKQHAAFVKQMAGQGNMAIDGMFLSAIRSRKTGYTR